MIKVKTKEDTTGHTSDANNTRRVKERRMEAEWTLKRQKRQ